MSRSAINSILWGLLALLLGVVGLLYNFGVLEPYRLLLAYALAAALAAGGIAFLVTLAFRPRRWSLTIPGFTLLALAGVVYLSTLKNVRPKWAGALFLGGIALAFLALFLSNRQQRWWALLQAGTIGVIAATVLGLRVLSDLMLGAVLFGGFALDFLLLYLLGGNRKRFWWSLVMAAVLGAFALTILASEPTVANIVIRLWPLLLVLIGAYLVGRLLTRRPTPPVSTRPVTAIDEAAPAAVPETGAEPARIVRPQPAATTAEPLPEPLASADVSDPAAALDDLLAASQTQTSPKEKT